jgi:hypothetical protein
MTDLLPSETVADCPVEKKYCIFFQKLHIHEALVGSICREAYTIQTEARCFGTRIAHLHESSDKTKSKKLTNKCINDKLATMRRTKCLMDQMVLRTMIEAQS